MHIVTKFLVVLAAVLSVLLAGLSVAYTANADRLVSEYRAEKNKNAGLKASHEADKAQLNAERDQMVDLLAQKQSELSALRSQLDSLSRERDTLVAENSNLRLDQARYTAQIDEFNSTISTLARLDEQQSAELAQLRDSQLQMGRRELELLASLNDARSELEVANETNRLLQIQIADLQDQQGSGRISSSDGGERVGRRAPSGFKGRLTQVTRNDAGQIVVSIDAGSSDQLAEGMELTISRNSSFVALLTLSRVDLNESVGVVDPLGRANIDVRAGDTVGPKF